MTLVTFAGIHMNDSMLIFDVPYYLRHIRIRDGEGQQQQPFNLNDADGVPGRLGLFKVVSIFVTLINSAKMRIQNGLTNTLKEVDSIAITGYFWLFRTLWNFDR